MKKEVNKNQNKQKKRKTFTSVYSMRFELFISSSLLPMP